MLVAQLIGAVTGFRKLPSDTPAAVEFISGYIADAEAFLSDILNEEGLIKNERIEYVKQLFHQIVLSAASERQGDSYDNFSRFDRYPEVYTYFAEQVLPRVIHDKLQTENRTLRIKVVGVSGGNELASLYLYLQDAFRSHAEWGRQDQWDIQLEGIDVSSEHIAIAKKRLWHVDWDPRSANRWPRIKQALLQTPSPQRRALFRLLHGNIAYEPQRAAFLKGADIIFANAVLHQIAYPARHKVEKDLLRQPAWIMSNDRNFYENSLKRSVVELSIQNSRGGGYAYYVAAPESVPLSQPEAQYFSFFMDRELSVEKMIDTLGGALPTSRYFNAMPEDRYSRSAHVSAVLALVRAGRLKLRPSTLQVLHSVPAQWSMRDPNQRWAKRLLRAHAYRRQPRDHSFRELLILFLIGNLAFLSTLGHSAGIGAGTVSGLAVVGGSFLGGTLLAGLGAAVLMASHNLPTNREFWSTYWRNPKNRRPSTNVFMDVTVFLRKFFRRLPPDAQGIDLGTGYGYVPRVASTISKSFLFLGVDLYEPEPAAIPDNVAYFQVNAENTGFLSHAYRFVTSVAGIEYMRMGKALDEVARLLDHDGETAIVMHKADSRIIQQARTSLDALRVLDTSNIFPLLKNSLRGGSVVSLDLDNAVEIIRSSDSPTALMVLESIWKLFMSGDKDFLSKIEDAEKEVFKHYEFLKILVERVAPQLPATEEDIRSLFARHGLTVDSVEVLHHKGQPQAWGIIAKPAASTDDNALANPPPESASPSEMRKNRHLFSAAA